MHIISFFLKRKMFYTMILFCSVNGTAIKAASCDFNSNIITGNVNGQCILSGNKSLTVENDALLEYKIGNVVSIDENGDGVTIKNLGGIYQTGSSNAGKSVIHNTGVYTNIENNQVISAEGGAGIINISKGIITSIANNSSLTAFYRGVSNSGIIDSINNNGVVLGKVSSAIGNDVVGIINSITNAYAIQGGGLYNGIENWGIINNIHNVSDGYIASGENAGIYNGRETGLIGIITNDASIVGEKYGVLNYNNIHEIVNNGTIQGSISGVMSHSSNSSIYSLINNGIVSGRDSGIALNGAMFNLLYNSGYISGDKTAVFISTASIASLSNTGNITGGETGLYITSADNQSSNNLTINNSGVIEGVKESVHLENSSATINNHDGTLNGNVALSSGILNITGYKSYINGVIKGNENSAINIGENDKVSNFVSKHNAFVDTVNIKRNSYFTLSDSVVWEAFNTVSNDGSVAMGNNSVVKVGQHFNNKGSLVVGIDDGTQSIVSKIDGSLVNSGVINLNRTNSSIVGSKLIITGNYVGDNGSINLNTVLGNDSSPTDLLSIEGNTSGKTYVRVNNVGGTGAKTINGIEIIHIGGHSEGEFIQNGRIVAGAYDYSLIRGTGNNANNWYLTNHNEPHNPGTNPDVNSGE
ncbi:autotransporter outer membrane beta-barrel domain-containing protein, partial [Escherichia coli]|nr:autotransporter outer membrane beta-barrel domain-containing protein [Escherichia coli]